MHTALRIVNSTYTTRLITVPASDYYFMLTIQYNTKQEYKTSITEKLFCFPQPTHIE
jgi:hypothetical protein